MTRQRPARMKIRILLSAFMLGLAACQTLPDPEEMRETACAELPCREAGTLALLDSGGYPHFFRVPAGPVFAPGLLSLVPGESAHLHVRQDGDGNGSSLEWRESPDEQTVSFRFSQATDTEGFPMRLQVHNRLDRPLYFEVEQHPADDDRFHPLAAPVVPANSRVQRHWHHLIVEIQIYGFQLAAPLQEGD